MQLDALKLARQVQDLLTLLAGEERPSGGLKVPVYNSKKLGSG